MEILEVLKKAIKEKKQIIYYYSSPKSKHGKRIGNPHAIFISTANNINIDIFKEDGVKTDPSKKIPDWRQYKVKYIDKVEITDKHFDIAKGYNPTSQQYSRAIAKL